MYIQFLKHAGLQIMLNACAIAIACNTSTFASLRFKAQNVYKHMKLMYSERV